MERSSFPDQWARCFILIAWCEPGKSQFIHLTLTADSSSLVFCLHLITPSLSPPFLPLLDAPRPPAEDRFILPDEFTAPAVKEMSRPKRSPINTNRVGGLNVETLVVADRKMLEKHGRENVTTYVLTVMNMVRCRRGRGKKDRDHPWNEINIVLRSWKTMWMALVIVPTGSCLFIHSGRMVNRS